MVNCLVRRHLVGLSGLEPLTSALSGPAGTRRSGHSRSLTVHERSPELTGGRPTIGLRVPDHPSPRALAADVGPLPVTSANLSGAPAAATAAEIRAQLGDAVELILDGGPSHGGPASTVVDCSSDVPRILRVGAVAPAAVADCLRLAALPEPAPWEDSGGPVGRA